MKQSEILRAKIINQTITIHIKQISKPFIHTFLSINGDERNSVIVEAENIYYFLNEP